MQYQLTIRFKRFLWPVIILLLLATPHCLALDPGIYQGMWSSRDGEIAISLAVAQDPQQVVVTINEHSLSGVEAAYLYAPSAVYPFLFLRASEENVDPQAEYTMFEHALYLIIGALEGGDHRSVGILRGFYEFSRVKNDHHGTVESVSYPIELVR